MSLSGRLLRGIKWYNFRNINGEYSPDVANDPHKMEEVSFYLEFIKGKDANKVHKILEKVKLADLQNKETLIQSYSRELDESLTLSPPIKETKPVKTKETK